MSFISQRGYSLGASVIVAIAALAGCSGFAGAPTFAPVAAQAVPPWNAPPPKTTVAWANVGFDPNQSGYNNRETTLGVGNVGSLAQLWGSSDVTMDDIVESNGVIYISGYSGTNGQAVQAFNEQTGSVLWTTETPNQSNEALAVGDGLVFAYTNGNQSVCAFKAKSGKKAWCASFPSSKYRIATPEGLTYANGLVIVPLLGGPYVANALVALNAKSGAQTWSTNTDNGGTGSLANTTRPIVSQGRVYDECDFTVGTGSKAFVDWAICAYDVSSGSMLWDYVPVAKPNFRDSVAAAGTGALYLSLLYYNPGSGPNALVQGLTSSGSLVWSNSYDLCHSDQGEFELATDGKTLFAQLDQDSGGGCGSQSTSTLYAFNTKKGGQLWAVQATGGNTFLDAPIVANGVVYSQNTAGIMAFGASNGTSLWTSGGGGSGACYGHCSAQPIVVNGRVDTPCGGFGNNRLCSFGLGTEKKRR